MPPLLQEFGHNLFKPLLLFLYTGFLIPILRIKFEFPKAVCQGLTSYLLLAIGWGLRHRLSFCAAVAVLAAGLLGPVQAAAEPSPEAAALKTKPIGQRVFKAIVEVDTPQKFEPGDKVDVSMVTLGGEGPHVERVLRGITIQSLTPVQGEPPESEETTVDKQHPAYPRRVAGFLVNASQLETIRLANAQGVLRIAPTEVKESTGVFAEIGHNFVTNLFQPLLLFFFMGFAIPLLHVPFEFPKQLYQALTIYLLVSIGWHGGELMAQLGVAELRVAGGLVVVGFITNGVIGIMATIALRYMSKMRRIDAVTVGAYYGSDSAGTFVTCLGILSALSILHDSYMPVMLAVMEIPGCLVGLYLVSRLRHQGMDASGNMPDEPGYAGPAVESLSDNGEDLAYTGASASGHAQVPVRSVGAAAAPAPQSTSILSPKILHEVFLNPGLFLLFGGIIVGYISGRQALEDPHVVEGPNHLFLFIFKGALCLFLLEMGITACERLRDLKTAGPGFIVFGLLAPNVFATIGMCVLHGYALAIGHHFELGTYALFAVLCGAASYIAVPAVQRIAIPEASPTLPLAASLGLTFSWNVTLGIPIYLQIAKAIVQAIPIA